MQLENTLQQTPTEYMKQRELTVNLNVTHTLLVKTRRCGNCSDERNSCWKQCFFFKQAPLRNIFTNENDLTSLVLQLVCHAVKANISINISDTRSSS